MPHRLVASFKATLEETRQADLLLHVADASSPSVQDQISAVFEVLQGLGIEEKDTLLVLNKVDQIESERTLHAIMKRYPNAVPISAKTGDGFERLATVVSDALSRSFKHVDIEMPINNGKLLAYLSAKGEVLSTSYTEDKILVHCRIPQKYLGRISDPSVTIEPHESNGLVNSHQADACNLTNPANGQVDSSETVEQDPSDPPATMDGFA